MQCIRRVLSRRPELVTTDSLDSSEVALMGFDFSKNTIEPEPEMLNG